MKILIFTIVFFLASCFNFAGVNWHDELRNTRWAGYDHLKFQANCSRYVKQRRGYNVTDGRLETYTLLNEEGLRIMETEGCGACHSYGATTSSILSIIQYKELPADRHTEDALDCILDKK